MSSADVVVIGGGPNALTAAALLAKAGRQVVLVERREQLGGLAVGDTFHTGYRAGGVLDDTRAVRPEILETLQLRRYGLERRPQMADRFVFDARQPQTQPALVLAGDPQRRAQLLAERSAKNADHDVAFRQFVQRFSPVVDAWLTNPALDLVRPEQAPPLQVAKQALNLRRLGRRDLLEFLRLPPMPIADFVAEWFDDPALQASLALPAVVGGFHAPRSPGTTGNWLLHHSAERADLAGGALALVEALSEAATAYGAQLRTGAEVREIVLSPAGQVRGVRLASTGDGEPAAGEERIEARCVVAGCSAKTALLELLPRAALPAGTERALGLFRTRGTTAWLHVALNAAPGFAGHADAVEFATTATSLDQIEQAFDPIKYRRFAEQPILQIHVPTVSRPELAPAGHAVLALAIHYVPYDLEGGWTEDQRNRLTDRVLGILESLAPGVGRTVVATRLQTPPDLEADYRLPGGQIHHGEHGLDQLLVRPIPDCAHYTTPIPGLFLCGGSSHPGGGLTCQPGALAAAAVARARG